MAQQPLERHRDVVVIGDGLIGMCVAYEAARRGHSVTVVGSTLDGAAYAVAAGMLAPVTEAHFGEEEMVRFNLEGAGALGGFLESVEADSGIQIERYPSSTLSVARDRDQAAALRRLHDFQRELGLDVVWCDRDRLRELEPGLHPSVGAGALAEADVALDPRRMYEAVKAAAARKGVGFVPHPATALDPDQERPQVETQAGPVHASCVVVAAGCWSGRIPGAPAELGAAIRPVKGQILRLRSTPDAPAPAHVLRSEEVYLVPRRDGEVVVGATAEERGFETTVTAGGVFELLRAADEIFPSIREMELMEVATGLRPGSRDNAPLIGPTSIPGVIAATGHYRNGVLLSAITATSVADLLDTGEVPEAVKPFDPLRFA